MSTTVEQPRQVRRERRIIERPRLIKMLDAAESRVILLHAPAGYGKTTLARQWVKTLSNAIWISATPAHRDVAVFADDVASGIDALGGNAAKFIREYVSAQSNPQRVALRIAAALAEQLKRARVAWIVIDDYQELADSPEMEAFLGLVQERTRIRLLVSSRVRPRWATARRVIYGELTEIDRETLAMDEQESFAVLGRRNDVKEIVQYARGWPAILTLISGLGPTRTPSNALPQALHQYLAEELFQSGSPPERDQLLLLALLPDLTMKSLQSGFKSSAPTVLKRARELGFVSTQEPPELHPLLKEFLLSKLEETPGATSKVREAVADCMSHDKWDQAFDLVRRFGLHEVVQEILVTAYKPLIRSGRLGSLSRFADEVRKAPSLPPDEVDLVDAEVALRDGAYPLAQQLATRVRNHLRPDSPLRPRAAAIAGAAAFQLADFDASEAAFGIARRDARDDDDVDEALHDLSLAAIYGERPGVDQRIEELGQRATETRTPLNIARHATAIIARMRIGPGFVEGPYMDDALRALDRVADPLARTSILLTLGYAMGLQADYGRALEATQRMLTEVHAFDLEFARPHGQWNLAFAKLGLRRFHEANTLLQEIQEAIRQRRLGHHALNAAALRARLLMQVARVDEAFALVRFDVDDRAAPSMHGEYLATRALAHALLGQDAEAIAIADQAAATSVASEVVVLAGGARSVVSARNDDPEAAAAVIELARTRQAWDPVVCCLRASQLLAQTLAAQETIRPTLEILYKKSGDRALARRAGFRIDAGKDATEVLTPREREVLQLLAQGFRNREIAEAFVISESTVKVHVRHVLDKIGAKTRTQAVARYQELTTQSRESQS